MANGQIRVTPEQMRARAKAFRTEGTNFESVIKKMQGLLDALNQEWEGEASRKFDAQFKQLKPSFEKVKVLIDDIGGQLDATAKSIEQLDRDIASKFGV